MDEIDESVALTWDDPFIRLLLDDAEPLLPFSPPSQEMEPREEDTDQLEADQALEDGLEVVVAQIQQTETVLNSRRSPPREPKKFKCPEVDCRWSFSTAYKLRRHSSTHASNKASFQCNEDGCGKTFATKYNLAAHAKDQHRDATETAPPAYPCSRVGCDLVFTSPKLLKRHVAKEHNRNAGRRGRTKPVHVCDFVGCERQFDRPSKLTVHRRTHTGERPYACDLDGCESRFARADQLKRHRDTHCSLAWLRRQYGKEALASKRDLETTHNKVDS